MPKSNIYVAVRDTLAGVRATGSRGTCERVATFLEGLALDFREIALTRGDAPEPAAVPQDARADAREGQVRAMLSIDPAMPADLICRVVGGRRATTLKLVRAVQAELKIPPPVPRYPILY